MKAKNVSPKTALGFLAMVVIGGIIANISTAPVERKMNAAKAKLAGKAAA